MKNMSILERKSSRPRKSINYTNFGDDSGSDDDFASSPSLKKQKTTTNKKEVKPRKEKKKTGSSQQLSSSSSISNSLAAIPSSILKRRSNFDDELQQALQLSMLEASGNESICDTDTSTLKSDHIHPVEGDHQATDCIVSETMVDIEPLPTVPRLEKIDIGKGSTPVPHLMSDVSPEPPKLVPVMTTSSACVAVLDSTIELVKSQEGSNRTAGQGRLRRTLPKKGKEMSAAKYSFTGEDDLDTKSEAGSDFVCDDESDSVSEEEDDDFSPSDDDSDFDDKKKKVNKIPSAKKGKKENPVGQRKSPSIVCTAEASSPKDNPVTTLPTVKNHIKNSTSKKPQRVRGKASSSTPTSSLAVVPSRSSAVSSSSSTLSSCPSSLATPQSSSTTNKPSKSSPGATSVPHLVSRQWKPPGQSTGKTNNSSPSSGSLLKSPSSGLRLGLSRNARVKPLHSSVVNVV